MAAANTRNLLLNRHSHLLLERDGLAELASTPFDLAAARRFAHWRKVSGSEFYLFGLLSIATAVMAQSYLEAHGFEAEADAVTLDGKTDAAPELDTLLQHFLECYPQPALSIALKQPQATTRRKVSTQLVAELFLLDALLDNPALGPFRDLFDDPAFVSQPQYSQNLRQLTSLMQPTAAATPWSLPLPELLRQPRRAGASLMQQVAFIRQQWALWLPQEMLLELRTAVALFTEEQQPRAGGPGPTVQPLFGRDDGSDLPAAFSADIDWMSGSVLLAKSIYVWLDQLSQRYQQEITRLDQIPQAELACLAEWGFNALWLIGIWERSQASKQIKQLRGNPEVEASAYALYAYRVSADLGGEAAFAVLEENCRKVGLRLACDVVPNHTGIDSEWLRQHPDWFVQSEQPPWPNYRFSGPDLCCADGVSVRIEDGYWDHSDAAVVCEHIDHTSGRRRYIYHGNDGTHMPWNDTAQLNFLLPQVRQAMSDLIVDVAKRFSLIRFDAAMTLARKHFRRLWFPPPGGSAGVPSRSEFWLSDDDFNAAFPVEFWRELVDRINREAPDTLLIAEAFWLMESYFVRNLGMHRVYNSAFMNMLKREENAKYQRILKDILAYNPEILKRYVNFMNNPDEATAVEQFGKGDKYFGVATLLATLPGLPMFGHGQIEGYREKYGMEYRRAYWDEPPDQGFVEHHQQQIFPLLQRRWLFAGVENFSLYEFDTAGDVNANVYAYSNGPPQQRHLVIFNNSAHATQGRLHRAMPKAQPDCEGQPRTMPPLWQELGFEAAQANGFCRFGNLSDGLEYLLPLTQLQQGLELQLAGYQHLVLHNFTLLHDNDGRWLKLYQQLNGKAVENMDREMQRLRYAPQWRDFVKLLNSARLQVLAGGLVAQPLTKPMRRLQNDLFGELHLLAEQLRQQRDDTADPDNTADSDNTGAPVLPSINLPALFQAAPQWLQMLDAQAQLGQPDQPSQTLRQLWGGNSNQPGIAAAILGWLLLRALGKAVGLESTALLEQFGLDYAWREQAQQQDVDESAGEIAAFTLLLAKTAKMTPHPALEQQAFKSLCDDESLHPLLGVNQHQQARYFSKERMTSLIGALAMQAGIESLLATADPAQQAVTAAKLSETARDRLARAAAVGYRLDKLFLLR